MLTIMPQRESYYHSTNVEAQTFYSCKDKGLFGGSSSCSICSTHPSTHLSLVPPQITAHCSDEGITFSVATPPGGRSLFEVGVDQEPLTPQLVEERGYQLYSDTQRTTLEVPVFSVGYTYKVRFISAPAHYYLSLLKCRD